MKDGQNRPFAKKGRVSEVGHNMFVDHEAKLGGKAQETGIPFGLQTGGSSQSGRRLIAPHGYCPETDRCSVAEA